MILAVDTWNVFLIICASRLSFFLNYIQNMFIYMYIRCDLFVIHVYFLERSMETKINNFNAAPCTLIAVNDILKVNCHARVRPLPMFLSEVSSHE